MERRDRKVFIQPFIGIFQAGRLVFVEIAVISADSGLRDDPGERTVMVSIGSHYETDEHIGKGPMILAPGEPHGEPSAARDRSLRLAALLGAGKVEPARGPAADGGVRPTTPNSSGAGNGRTIMALG